MEPTEKAIKDLSDELTKALDRPLPLVFREGLRSDVETFPQLANAVRSVFPDKWDDDQANDALIDVMRQAIKLLPTDSVLKFANKTSKISTHTVASILCGLAIDLPKRPQGGRYTYDELRGIAIDLAGFKDASARTFQRNIATRIKNMLADVLINRRTELRGSVALQLSLQATSSSGYVRRLGLESEFQAALAEGARTVVFVGQAGMGKTWAARELAQRSFGSPVPTIRFDKGEPNSYDLQGALLAAGFNVSANDPAAGLAALCCGENAAPAIMLDNFDSADELVPVLPHSRRSTIIASCRVKGAVQPADFRFIAVDRMNLPEAIELALLNHRLLDPGDAEELANFLHGHPLVIQQACVLLRKAGMPVHQFCIELRAEAVSRLNTSDQDTLGGVLQRITTTLKQEDQLAYELLWLMPYIYFYGHRVIDNQTLWSLFRTQLGSYVGSNLPRKLPGPSRPNELRLEIALAVLTDYSLINLDRVLNDRGPGLRSVRFVDVHPLTLALLFKHFAGKERQFLANLWSAISQVGVADFDWGSYDQAAVFYVPNLIVKAIHDMIVERHPGLLEFVTSNDDHSQGFERLFLTIYDKLSSVQYCSIDEPLAKWVECNRERCAASEPTFYESLARYAIDVFVFLKLGIEPVWDTDR